MVSSLPREGSYIKYTEVLLFVKQKFTHFFLGFSDDGFFSNNLCEL